MYRSCPKHTKLLVAKAIVQAVQQQEPAGRFLECADRNEGLWKQISYKRAVDKTSQALREKDLPVGKGGVPSASGAAGGGGKVAGTDNVAAAVLAKKAASRKGNKKDQDLSDLAQATLKTAGFIADQGGSQRKVTPASAILPPPAVNLGNNKKRKPPPQKPDFVKPNWWGGGGGGGPAPDQSVSNVNMGRAQKRVKTEEIAPPPLEPLQTRQSSLFRFLSNTSIFGGGSDQQQQQQQQQRQQSFGGNFFGTRQQSMGMMPGPTNQPLQMGSSTFLLDPLPIGGNNNSTAAMRQQQHQKQNSGVGPQPQQVQQMQERMIQMQQHMQQQMQMQMEQLRQRQLQQRTGGGGGGSSNVMLNDNTKNPLRSALRSSLVNNNSSNGGMDHAQANYPNSNNAIGGDLAAAAAAARQGSSGNDNVAVAPPANKLTSQVSDWLTSFFPLGKDANEEQQLPPPAADNLQRSVSSTLINFARSPSQFLTSLRTGVSSMFGDPTKNDNNGNGTDDDLNPVPLDVVGGVGSSGGDGDSKPSAAVLGTESRGDSLLDDYEETPLETRLRTGVSS